LPSDFNEGHSEGDFLGIPYSGPDLNPAINCQIISFTGGRSYSIGKNAWFEWQAGPSLVKSYKASFERQAVTSTSGGFLSVGGSYTTSSNYKMRTTPKTGAGIFVRADLDWALGRHFGMGLSVNNEFSSVQSPLFFQVKMIAGHFGISKKTKIASHKTKTP
jgi:hypothetical protein